LLTPYAVSSELFQWVERGVYVLRSKQKPGRDVGQDEAKIVPGKPKTDHDDQAYDPNDPFDPFDTNEPDRPKRPKGQPGYDLPDDEPDEEQDTDSNVRSTL
jgi:hypothetical protein